MIDVALVEHLLLVLTRQVLLVLARQVLLVLTRQALLVQVRIRSHFNRSPVIILNLRNLPSPHKISLLLHFKVIQLNSGFLFCKLSLLQILLQLQLSQLLFLILEP